MSIRQGEVLALVGESGCGKTVLCRSILKLLPKSASVTGEAIQYKDQNLIGYNEKRDAADPRTWNRDGLFRIHRVR